MGIWIKLSVDYYEDEKVVQAGVEGEVLFVRSLAWCKKHSPDGQIPNHMISRLGVGLGSPSEAAISLCEARLWVDRGDRFEIAKWASWNVQDGDRSKGGKLGQHRRWHATVPNPNCEFCDNSVITQVITEQNRTEQNRLFVSQDATRLCDLLAELITANGAKAPKVTDTWLSDMDRIIRIDKIETDEIERVIRWCQADEFWHANILSPGKLRKQMPQLMLKSRRQSTTAVNNDRIEQQWQLVLHEVRKVGSYGTPHFEDAQTVAAVKAIGWRNICQSTQPDKLRQTFTAAYISSKAGG